jgi:glucosamine--fructose-6-phosphate aminotransferase (isomerizing)
MPCTIEMVASSEQIHAQLFGAQAPQIFKELDLILILACGTSNYAGQVAKYWLESIAGIPTSVEVASEYRYRTSVPNPRQLVVAISQSGETADTLAALRFEKSLGQEKTLAICNVPESAIVRECQLRFITRAGPEIGVASTKAFTTQLAALFMLTLAIAKEKNALTPLKESQYLNELRHLPAAVIQVLTLEESIKAWVEKFGSKQDAIFLGRGRHYPIALEGALKLKEISYIHAEAYPAGELKHGPLALIDSEMQVVAIASNDELLEKLKSNLQEVKARSGELIVFADQDSYIAESDGIHILHLPEHHGELSPVLHTVALQLFAYHCALIKGNDVDKPRNLAKSVTVD